MSHRGRDNARVIVGGTDGGPGSPGIGLGHRRLSVIDLSDAAAQPMSDGRGLWVVFNGEIYNYRSLRQELEAKGYAFRTVSDTEVLLAGYRQWHDGLFERLDGMFAIAIWDDAERLLTCARDPVGIKPFYWTTHAGDFWFASEARALARLAGPCLDRDAALSYLLAMYVPGPRSVFQGIYRLRPGHVATIDADGRMNLNRFGRAIRFGSSPMRDDVDRFIQAEIDRAVQAQLRSDVPVGALLSGGFDSGLVVASAMRQGAQLRTYSVGFDDRVQADELPTASALASRLGTAHSERRISSAEVIGLLDGALTAMSEPVADSAIVPTFALADMAARDGIKVLLSGTGGDEVFVGYPRYLGGSRSRQLLSALPLPVRHAIARAAGPVTPVTGARLRHVSLDMLMTTGGSARLVDAALEHRGLGGFLGDVANAWLPPAEPGRDVVYSSVAFDINVYLPDLLLLELDQLTMAHTVEGRVPLLDVGLMAASLSQPSKTHLTGSHMKSVLRRLAQGQLMPETLSAPKQGFSGPVGHWIENNRAVFEERIMAVRELDVFANIPVESWWRDPTFRAHPRWPAEIFSLFCFVTWWRSGGFDRHAH